MEALDLVVGFVLGGLAWIAAAALGGPWKDPTDAMLPCAVAFSATVFAWLRWGPL